MTKLVSVEQERAKPPKINGWLCWARFCRPRQSVTFSKLSPVLTSAREPRGAARVCPDTCQVTCALWMGMR